MPQREGFLATIVRPLKEQGNNVGRNQPAPDVPLCHQAWW